MFLYSIVYIFHSRLIPMCNARFIMWPSSLSSPIRKEVSERPNAGNEISAPEAVAMPRNAVTAGAVDRYESRNAKRKIPKLYQYI